MIGIASSSSERSMTIEDDLIEGSPGYRMKYETVSYILRRLLWLRNQTLIRRKQFNLLFVWIDEKERKRKKRYQRVEVSNFEPVFSFQCYQLCRWRSLAGLNRVTGFEWKLTRKGIQMTLLQYSWQRTTINHLFKLVSKQFLLIPWN